MSHAGVDHSKFAVLSLESLKLYTEAVGVTNLSEEASKILSEDVSYRLRELVHNAQIFMRNSKRRRLNCNDINRALEWSDCEPIFGHSNLGERDPKSIYCKEAKVFTIEDPKVNLDEAVDRLIDVQNCEVFVETSNYLPVRGKHLNLSDYSTVEYNLNSDLINYYKHITNAILGNDSQLLNIALRDLSSNHKIQTLLPYFVNFISVGIKKLNHDLVQVNKLLRTIEAVISNNYLSINFYLDTLVQSLTYSLLETLDPINDHWLIRDKSANLLSNILQSLTPNIINDVWSKVVVRLRENIFDTTRSFGSHYGGFMFFFLSDPEIFKKHLYPHINDYLTYLTGTIHSHTELYQNKIDANKVYGTLLLIVEKLIKQQRKLILDNDYNENTNINQLYTLFYELFGDSLSAKLPTDSQQLGREYYRLDKQSQYKTFLIEPEIKQTGEELLDAFYETHHEHENSLLDDDNSVDDNSAISDEKEIGDNHNHNHNLQMKSSISNTGIKLTIKLKRHQSTESQNDFLSKILSDDIDDDYDDESCFEHFEFKQIKPIIINIKGATNKTSLKNNNLKYYFNEFSPSKWYLCTHTLTNKRRFVCKRNFKKRNVFCLYSCNLFSLL